MFLLGWLFHIIAMIEKVNVANVKCLIYITWDGYIQCDKQIVLIYVVLW